MKQLVLISALMTGCFMMYAQNDICDDYDCPSEIYEIQLDEPRVPTPEDNFSEVRTRKFQGAYMAFTGIQQKQRQSADWNNKYEESQLGGKKCLRYYQIQAALGHETVKISSSFRTGFVGAGYRSGFSSRPF